MEIELRSDCEDSDWLTVSETLREVGMAHYEPEIHRKAFQNSSVRVFAYNHGRLIGFGRAISDGTYQAAIYDVAIKPGFQKRGLGTIIINDIVSRLPSCNFILYTMPGKEDFYRKLGFRKMNTGMAMFVKADDMKLKGFTE